MSFSFDSTVGTSQSTAKPRLEGNAIHTVKFVGATIDDIKGVKEPDKVFKVLKLRFETEDKYFEHTVFEPKPDDFKRVAREATKKDGQKIEILNPSNVESMMLFFKHAIDSINPEVASQLDSKKKSLSAPDWDSLRKMVAKILDMGKGTEVRIKLLQNKKGEAIFPSCTGLTREGIGYVNNNIIGFGAKIAFTAYEKERIDKERTASPTPVQNMNEVAFKENTSNTAGLDLEWDV